MKIALVNVCDDYWMRWKLGRQSLIRSWQRYCREMPESAGRLVVVTVTTNEIEETSATYDKTMVLENLQVSPMLKLKKAALIREGVMKAISQTGGSIDLFGFIDSDIIYPLDLFEQVAQRWSPGSFMGSRRSHLTALDTQVLLSRKVLPDESELASLAEQADTSEPGHESPFMGWFQVFSPSMLTAVPFGEYASHEGYDKFDYAVAERLKTVALDSVLVEFSRPPLHLNHGSWGSNWNGCTRPH